MDPLGVIQAGYERHADLGGWLGAVAEALDPLLGQGFGTLACRVAPGTERFTEVVGVGGAPLDAPQRLEPFVPPAFFRALFHGVGRLGWASEQLELARRRRPALSPDVPGEFFAFTRRQYGFDDLFALTL
ncbi:MAG: hypothetical protein R3F59_38415, partial [Myxococcota bacterium]